MAKQVIIFLILALWLGAYGWSVIALWVLEPTGDGFTRGLNRVTAFVGWQIVAGVLAIFLFVLRGTVGPAWLRRALWAPLILALLLLLFIVGLIVWSWINHLIWAPGGYTPPPGAVTQP